MSAKWIRSKKWDDEHLTGWLWPVKVVLRTFSAIPTAIVLLSLVTLYGILASVTIGLFILLPTILLYAATVLVCVGVLGVLPVRGMWSLLSRTPAGRAVRFPILLVSAIVLTVASLAAWRFRVWPSLRYDAEARTGVRLFAAAVERYQSVQFRRLPMMEMSELEFYAWWPLRVVLVLFILNMVTATLRRIEFRFPYIGVLTVHTGIVVIALGSIYYSSQKQEGDMILLAGEPDAEGHTAPGAPETGFYDNTRPALWVTQRPEQGWEQRPLRGLPRYNDYNLNALGLKNLPPMARGDARDLGPVNISVVEGPGGPPDKTAVDGDIHFRIVGYAPFADLVSQWVPEQEARTGRPGAALRTIEAYLALPPDPTDPPDAADTTNAAGRPRKSWRLMPDSPAQRVETLSVGGSDLLGLEYTRGDTGGRGMTEQRWQDLASPLPRGTEHALIVRHKSSGFAGIFPVQQGQRLSIGATGYSIEVSKLAPTPPFPIITRGYQGARSSVAVVHITRAGEQGASTPAYERWVYSRFPEINQDLVDAPPSEKPRPAGEPPMPRRRAADPDLDIVYLDASVLQVYFDERPDGTVRALTRLPRGGAAVTPRINVGESVEVAPGFTLKLADRLDNAVLLEYPFSTPTASRDPKSVGNHQRAAIAVEVSTDAPPPAQRWASTVWVPFTQYARAQTQEAERTVPIPDGRRVRLMFGRVRHEFWPPMAVRLTDFEMTPYEHSATPRDFSSELVVMRRWSSKFEDVRARTSLNEPLLERTPFEPRPDSPRIISLFCRLLSIIAPNQYKFSQAGWDQGGWTDSAAAVERGELKRPFARYTILGVGNNPGIYIIASGAVMMSVGIPWAFYVKPWLVRRKKHKIQRQLASGEPVAKPRRAGPAAGTTTNEYTHDISTLPEPVTAESKDSP